MASPAAGDLELVRTFANTADLEAGSDQLDSPTALRDWLAQRALLDDGARVDDDGLAAARRMREALRALALANAGHDADLSDFNRLAAAHHLVVHVGPDGLAALAPAADAQGLDAALGRLLAITYGAMADGSWPRLKACANDACRWLFYDRSKNRSKRWCTMDICGDTANSRAYRRRQRDAAT